MEEEMMQGDGKSTCWQYLGGYRAVGCLHGMIVKDWKETTGTLRCIGNNGEAKKESDVFIPRREKRKKRGVQYFAFAVLWRDWGVV